MEDGNWPLALYLNPCLEPDDLRRRFEALHERGITRIGTDGCSSTDYELIDRFAKACERSAMDVVSVHGVGALVARPGDDQQARVKALKLEVDRCAAWGSRRLVFHSRSVQLPWHAGTFYEEAALIHKMGLDAFDELLVENLVELCVYAATKDITVGLENLLPATPFNTGVADVLDVIAKVAAKMREPANLGVILDSGHSHLCGKVVADEMRLAGSSLRDTHFHDNIGVWREDVDPRWCDLHLAPGLGTIDWIAVVQALKEIEYPGPIVFEVIGGERYRADFATGVDMLVRNWRAFEAVAADFGTDVWS